MKKLWNNQQTMNSYMHCSIKDFFQIHEKKLTLLPFSTKIVQHVCSLPICQKCLHVPSILVCHIDGFNFKEYHQRISLQTKLPRIYVAKVWESKILIVLGWWTLFWGWEGESLKKLQKRVFSMCKNDFSLLHVYKVISSHFN